MDDARLFLCARCRRQVLICSRCDRGQHYCGARCGGLARRESLRGAGRRYQHSRRGRHCHAERQRRYRRRCREGACTHKVTHHGSAGAPCDAELAPHRVAMREANPPMSPKPATERARAASGTSQDALPLLRAPGQRVRPSGVASPAGTTTRSASHLALSGEHDGDRRRAQGADPALPLRRALAGRDHRLPARGPSLHRRAGAGRGRGEARAPAPASPLEARPLQSELA